MAIKTSILAKAEKMWAEGVPVKRIADECNEKYDTLMHYVCNHRDRFPARRKSARLTDEQKERISQLNSLGVGPTAIAREAGCSKTTARHYVGRR